MVRGGPKIVVIDILSRKLSYSCSFSLLFTFETVYILRKSQYRKETLFDLSYILIYSFNNSQAGKVFQPW